MPPNDHFQSLADGAPVMIWMSGLDMGCFYFNRAWLDFRGRTLEEESGNGWAEGVHPEDLDRCVQHYVSCFERRVAFAMTYRLRHYSGEFRWILDRGMPHYLPDGSFLGFFGGCAEIMPQQVTTRHVQLRGALADMASFAKRMASEEALNAGLIHATTEMRQLAADMAIFAEMPAGACEP